jgi:putative ABC transport system ATP-binding protein
VFTAVENVELPLLVTGVKAKEARARAEQMLELVGLGHRLRNRPPELSGGEQQRVAIARALVTEPAIVWADEPTGNLDSETAASVLALLKDVHAAGQTIVMVTHDIQIGRAGTRLVKVTDGVITYDGGVDVLDVAVASDVPKPATRRRRAPVTAK